MGSGSTGKVYVEVTATTRPDGSIEPRFIRWPDGRLFPIAAAEGGPVPDYFEPGEKPAKVASMPFSFRVFVGRSRTVRRLYLEFAEGLPPRWYVNTDGADVPYEPIPPRVPLL